MCSGVTANEIDKLSRSFKILHYHDKIAAPLVSIRTTIFSWHDKAISNFQKFEIKLESKRTFPELTIYVCAYKKCRRNDRKVLEMHHEPISNKDSEITWLHCDLKPSLRAVCTFMCEYHIIILLVSSYIGSEDIKVLHGKL